MKSNISIFIVLIMIFNSCSTFNSKKKSLKNKNYEFVTNSDGKLEKVISWSTSNPKDSAVIYFYDNGNIKNITQYSGKNIYPNSSNWYNNGGISVLYQYMKIGSKTAVNQIYTFDSEQNLIRDGSLFGVVDYKQDSSTVWYLNGLNKDEIVIALIDSIADDSIFVPYKEIEFGNLYKKNYPYTHENKYKTYYLFKDKNKNMTGFLGGYDNVPGNVGNVSKELVE